MKKLANCDCFAKYKEWAPLILRVVVGIIFLVHGWQKFGDVSAVEGFLTSLSFPAAGFFAWILTLLEVLGGIALILGFWTHWTAKLLALDMILALLLVHAKNGFMVSDRGYEYVLLLLAATASLAITGAGTHSLDGKMK